MMMEVHKREESGIVPDVDIDTFMKVLELDIFGDTTVGDEMRRGISGGQKRRLSTADAYLLGVSFLGGYRRYDSREKFPTMVTGWMSLFPRKHQLI
ncbi:pleiotropic drug resistance protein 3-like [Mangifera indica]|uniref:pleiotropic drug resistance protein 3-like n=1 Tax=Mangifera indica TaxID=29780 RepID=UPI001CFBD862|nr:pleiotropic drug resistance protein 3-like [Mangifera indica]XP_044477925.1 pleiotropic drug resistance protein 3-like [Mangifera indica]